jgi:hypothetical protein
MRERKPYPNISDEELDRRAEETLRRMLANPKQAQQLGHSAPANQGQQRGDGQPTSHQGQGQGQGHSHNPNPNQNQPGRGKRRPRRRPR